ncbi:MAG: mechanosensitive ion channel [Bacteroidaceae bacterium]|nr:mechanosensitive ion channel [Bacteroidaceae bacterium]
MGRRIIVILLAITFGISAFGVLKEKDLDQTLLVLRSELQTYHKDLRAAQERSKEQRVHLRAMLDAYLDEANQISLMVYSQQQDYVFDMTYACHQATELYDRFHSRQIPFDTLSAQLDIEVARYKGLVAVLADIRTDSTDTAMTASRERCIALSNVIHRELESQREELLSLQDQYNKVDSQLTELKAYAQVRYRNLQNGIFRQRGESYISLLRNFYNNATASGRTITDKYAETEDGVQSQWRGTIVYMVFAIMFFYALVAMLIGWLIWRYALPRFKRIEAKFDSPVNAILCFAMGTFAIVVGILNMVIDHNFIHSASGLLVQFAWLATAIQLSLIIRMKDGKAELAGLKIYAPMLAMGFFVIVMRVIFIPSAIIALYFPPLLVLTAIWQFIAIKRHGGVMPRSDLFYAWVTLAVIIASITLAMVGRTLMAVEVFIWWMMQITCIQTIVCMYDLLERYEMRCRERGATFAQTWHIDLVNRVLLPVTGVMSVLFSIYWSADVFDMTDWVWEEFTAPAIDIEGVITFSLGRLCTVIALYFIFRYLAHLVRELLQLRYGNTPNGQGAIVIGRNITSILIWGAWLIISMLTLNIGNSWVLVITGGLSTGIGFAMKDTLENFFYGVSLMLGRLHIGDIIECDGVRGTVSNISYQSTIIQASDGSEMAFLNSQLFSKNFKNMTHNHNLELVVIPVGVAYGTNVAHVRTVLTAALEHLDCYDKARGISIAFLDFGASSVDLKVCVWVEVMRKAASVALIKETIYDTLNHENIEIPFPQLDVHQK